MKVRKACCKELWDQEYVIVDTKTLTFDIEGCCGGGCNVLTDGKFCPFCGTKLSDLQEVELKEGEA